MLAVHHLGTKCTRSLPLQPVLHLADAVSSTEHTVSSEYRATLSSFLYGMLICTCRLHFLLSKEQKVCEVKLVPFYDMECQQLAETLSAEGDWSLILWIKQEQEK